MYILLGVVSAYLFKAIGYTLDAPPTLSFCIEKVVYMICKVNFSG